MKTLIIRKPKFMRSDAAMQSYLDVALAVTKLAEKSESAEEAYHWLTKAAECLDKAAKAGGFFNTKDFLKWAKIHTR